MEDDGGEQRAGEKVKVIRIWTWIFMYGWREVVGGEIATFFCDETLAVLLGNLSFMTGIFRFFLCNPPNNAILWKSRLVCN